MLDQDGVLGEWHAMKAVQSRAQILRRRNPKRTGSLAAAPLCPSALARLTSLTHIRPPLRRHWPTHTRSPLALPVCHATHQHVRPRALSVQPDPREDVVPPERHRRHADGPVRRVEDHPRARALVWAHERQQGLQAGEDEDGDAQLAVEGVQGVEAVHCNGEAGSGTGHGEGLQRRVRTKRQSGLVLVLAKHTSSGLTGSGTAMFVKDSTGGRGGGAGGRGGEGERARWTGRSGAVKSSCWSPIEAHLNDPVQVEPDGRNSLEEASDDDANWHQDSEADPHEEAVSLPVGMQPVIRMTRD